LYRERLEVQARSTRVARVSLKPFPLHQIDERVSFEISPFEISPFDISPFDNIALLAHLKEIYGASVGRDTISRVTAAVLADAKEWQARPLESVYPIVFLDAMVIKIRDGNAIRKHSVYLAIGVNTGGERDVLGMWFQKTEGAKFWLQVLSELKQRGVADVLVCCVDGLTGFPEAIEAVYPHAWVQTCVVHYADVRVMPMRGEKAPRVAESGLLRSA